MTYQQAMKKVREGKRVWHPGMNSRWYILRVGAEVRQQSDVGGSLSYVASASDKSRDDWRVI